MMEVDVIIRNGKVYDGTGGEPVEADIAVAGGRILSLSRCGETEKMKAREVIEAKGLSVAPGFIDAHAHSEFTLLADNRAEGKVLQGITTEINGNCGLSAAPLFGEALARREEDLKDLGIRERWNTFREYFDLLGGRGVALNFATLAGHGNVRASVIGYHDLRPDDAEMESMSLLLRQAVGDGAIGLSTGLIYPPGIYSETEELIRLCACIRDFIYATHMRSEGRALTESVEETLRIGRESGIRVHVSHIKTSGRDNWHKIERVISLIETARRGGQRVTADRYPYTAASTDLDAVLPAWTYAGGVAEELRRLEDPETRARIRGEVLAEHPREDYWEAVSVASANGETNRWTEGMTIAGIAKRKGREPVDLLLDLLLEEKLRVGAIFSSMNEENLRTFLSLPYVMIGTDSSARSTGGPTQTGKPHPRGFGTFPRLLGLYAREQERMSIAKAIHKSTMLPAETFGLSGRGRIGAGFAADLVVFDEERVIDRSSFGEPFLKPEGIHYVFVNGEATVREGCLTKALPGKILRHGK